MNRQSTLDKLSSMRLRAMSELYRRSLEQNSFPHYTTDEFIALMVDAEWEARHNQKIAYLTKSAQLAMNVSYHDMDYSTHRGLDKNSFERLLSLVFMDKAENIILTGPTGVGKSYLAQSIGIQACTYLRKTLYMNWLTFSEKVKLAKLDGTYLKLLSKLQQTDLLIIDDFGLHSFDTYTRSALMDVVEAKYNKTSIIICAQIPVSQWHALIGEGTIADAILDRLVHASHRIELSGESLRKNRKLQG